VTSTRAARLLLPVIYLGYISLGLPDGTLGVAWPQAHASLHTEIGMAGPLLLFVTLLAAISGFSSGRVIRRFRTGPVVLISCALTGSGLLLISRAPSFAWLFLAALPLGFGAGAVDAGLNGYVARHYTGRHMNWLHACWGIGATCGPLAMATALRQPEGWRLGYRVLGSTQLFLALVFLLTLQLWSLVPERTVAASAEHTPVGQRPTLPANSPAGWLSAGIFALYVAIEGTAGLWASSILVESRGFAPAVAGLCTSAYYGSITTGRIAVGFVVDRWGNRRLIAIGTALAVVGAGLFTLAHTAPFAAAALILLGLGFAPVYPCMMHEVPRRFAPEAVQTVIGRQSGASYIGGALLPAAAGYLAHVSLESICWVVGLGAILLIAAVRRLDRMT
jgi:MFS family permease